MSETGVILDAVLMLLLVAALGFGLRLERRLSALRAGQEQFGRAVGELNAAAGRAEAALASLRAAGQETDLLHDRIVAARALKAELEGLMSRAAASAPMRPVDPPMAAQAPQAAGESDAMRRMAALAERLSGVAAAPAPGPVLQALATRPSLRPVEPPLRAEPTRRAPDEDLFAA